MFQRLKNKYVVVKHALRVCAMPLFITAASIPIEALMPRLEIPLLLLVIGAWAFTSVRAALRALAMAEHAQAQRAEATRLNDEIGSLCGDVGRGMQTQIEGLRAELTQARGIITHAVQGLSGSFGV